MELGKKYLIWQELFWIDRNMARTFFEFEELWQGHCLIWQEFGKKHSIMYCKYFAGKFEIMWQEHAENLSLNTDYIHRILWVASCEM